MEKKEFVIKDITPGKLNALVRNIMEQAGTEDPDEAVRLVNSGKWKVTWAFEKELLLTTKTGIEVYDHGDHLRFKLPASSGKTGNEWINYFENKNYVIGDHVYPVLRSKDFNPTNGVIHEVIILKGGIFVKGTSLSGENIISHIRDAANKCGFETPNPEIACLIRDNFTNEEIGAMGNSFLVVMHEHIEDSFKWPYLLQVGSNHSKSLIFTTEKSNLYGSMVKYGFVFTVSQVQP